MMAKIEITVTKEVKKTIDVDFPYYYKCDFNSDHHFDSFEYGKINKDRSSFSIQEHIAFDDSVSYEINTSGFANYFFKEKHKSTAKEYEAAKNRAMEFLSKF